MINSPSPPAASGYEADSIDAIVRAGPRGALAVAGVATAIVVALWFAFYWLVLLPRSTG